jgi:hypothetical protein
MSTSQYALAYPTRLQYPAARLRGNGKSQPLSQQQKQLQFSMPGGVAQKTPL